MFVQSYNGGGRAGQGGRAEGMSGKERKSEERNREGERKWIK